MFLELLGEREQFGGPANTGLLRYLSATARHYVRTGDIDNALIHARRAHAIGLTITPRGAWLSALATAEYGDVLLAAGRTDEARPFLEQAHAKLNAVFGADDPRVPAHSPRQD